MNVLQAPKKERSKEKLEGFKKARKNLDKIKVDLQEQREEEDEGQDTVVSTTGSWSDTTSLVR